MEDIKETLNEVYGSIKQLGREYPDFMKAFSGFMGEANGNLFSFFHFIPPLIMSKG